MLNFLQYLDFSNFGVYKQNLKNVYWKSKGKFIEQI